MQVACRTYIKFEQQESKQRIRQESKLPVSGSPPHRHAQCPIAAFADADKSFSCMHQTCIKYTMRIATVSNILIKQHNSISAALACGRSATPRTASPRQASATTQAAACWSKPGRIRRAAGAKEGREGCHVRVGARRRRRLSRASS